MNWLKIIRWIKKFLNKTNFFDFILHDALNKGPLQKTIKEFPSIKKEVEKVQQTIKGQIADSKFLNFIVNKPDELAKMLTKLSPQELAKLSEAIAEARAASGIKDNETGAEAQALSSSWLIYGEYTPINEKSGTIRITTIQGKSYDFPKPIKYATWERMKYAQGRNGTGAGQIFWDEYWGKIKGRQVKPGVATLFKLLEFKKRKNQANKVVKNTKKELSKKGYKKWS